MEPHFAEESQIQPFAVAREYFETLVAKLENPQLADMTHSKVEDLLFREGNELMRILFQGYFDSLHGGVAEEAVRGADGVELTHHRELGRNLMTRFGMVRLSRMGYGLPEITPLYPLDAQLNMPSHSYSHGVERLMAKEIAKNSFDAATATIDQLTGAHVPKRQAEEIAIRSACDFDRFYAQAERAASIGKEEAGPLMVVTFDGKGVVMRKEDLREATRKAAEAREHKLTTRLSKGEKRNAKRNAQVAAVYTIQPHYRTAEEVIGQLRPVHGVDKKKRPRPEHKRVWASLKHESEEVIDEAFQEGLRRDPEKQKTWLALVDGQPTQKQQVQDAAKEHGICLIMIVDFIHVLEYLWKAGRELLGEGAESEDWVLERARRVLEGEASLVAAGIRRSATKRSLPEEDREQMDACADYLLKNASYLRYDHYLKNGYPIATGVIEGACRHLVKDRMEITGARWRLERAESVLQLRALLASGDFEAYWDFHEAQEHWRNQASHYYEGKPAPIHKVTKLGHQSAQDRPALRLVKS